jgi:hypothetical protein
MKQIVIVHLVLRFLHHKTDHHDETEILLKMALTTINHKTNTEVYFFDNRKSTISDIMEKYGRNPLLYNVA